MKMTFRIECPLCKWGNQWNDGYINMGWIGLICTHCEEKFFAKITINDIKVEITDSLPEDVPCQNPGVPK